MKTPSIQLNIPPKPALSISIWIEPNLLDQPEKWLPESGFSHCVIITDENVKPLYGEPLLKKLESFPFKTTLLSFPAGESAKNQNTLQTLMNAMFEKKCGRDTLLLALGGGVTGDLAGFIASIYMRGIPFIQIPTSFLAMVDSSVGGKTGIDNTFGKNLVGSFYQPQAVVADIHTLRTLPENHLINGFFESIKMFLTNKKESFKDAIKTFELFEKRDQDFLKRLITQSIQIKANIVEQDEKEHGIRAALNFGHTIGHALEKITDYELLHGFAVGLGMLVESKISELLGILGTEDFQVIQSALNRLGIEGHHLNPFDPTHILESTQQDKKTKNAVPHYILLKKPGEIYIKDGKVTHPVPDEMVKKALQYWM